MAQDEIRVPKKGEPDPTKEDTVSVRGGKRRAVKVESLVSLVRGALRSRAPNIKDRKQRIADAVDGAIDDADRYATQWKFSTAIIVPAR